MALDGDPDFVMGIRIASRTIVRELGFMHRHLAGTDLTPAQVHALLELEANANIRAVELTELLRLDKSATSRLLGDLVRRGYISNAPSNEDARAKQLRLTVAGTKLLATIHRRTNRQIVNVLDTLQEPEKLLVLQGLSLYADALKHLYQNRAASRSEAWKP